MEIVKAKRADMVIEIDGAKLTFAPSSMQDMVYATNLIDNLATKGMSITPIDRDTCLKHVFSKLRAVEGVRAEGKDLTVDELKALAPQAESSSVVAILSAWALAVCRSEGFIKEAEEKNAPSEMIAS